MRVCIDGIDVEVKLSAVMGFVSKILPLLLSMMALLYGDTG
jgi:F0F1-type ATP synthase assembly protein I